VGYPVCGAWLRQKAKIPVRDLAALVLLEERGSARGSFRRRLGGEGGTGLRDVFFVQECFFELPKQKGRYARGDFVCEHKERLEIHAQALGAVLNLDAQAGAREELQTRGGSLSSEGANGAAQAERSTPITS
jgi:hypothetical protein